MEKSLETLLHFGMRAHAEGDFDSATQYYSRALCIDPNNQVASGWLGTIEAQRGNLQSALTLLKKSLELNEDPDFLLSYANVLLETRDYENAKIIYKRAIKYRRNHITLTNISACYNELGDFRIAFDYADQALSFNAHYPDAWNNRGSALRGLFRLEEALSNYDLAIKYRDDFHEAWANRGNLLRDLRRYEEALCSFNRAVSLMPNYAKAWNNRGVVLRDLRRCEEALASLDRATSLMPTYAKAWNNRGVVLRDLRRFEDAIRSYETAYELEPDLDYLLGDLIHTQMKVCNWNSLQQRISALKRGLVRKKFVSTPFPILGLFDSPSLQRRCAELYLLREFSKPNRLESLSNGASSEKVRIAYFSMDFREHPVSRLIAELIELHDREKFEVYGFSFGGKTNDLMRQRLEVAFDQFIDIDNLSEVEIVRLARQKSLDIAIDLGGYTQDSRPEIFINRVAPVQINYLGFPGTSGCHAIDYIIADPILIPKNSQNSYTEKIIYLPHCYQVNDSNKLVSKKLITRADFGLPQDKFIFCCFNNNWKITPEIIGSWAFIMKSVPNAVLWLYEDNPIAAKNISREFANREIAASRLFFAHRIENSEHLARYQLADLFLDTFPYGAHTTASDALWVGLPLLTRIGESFASRVAGSLLNAVGLPELITRSRREYELSAIALALEPSKIGVLKERLISGRSTHPLFNTKMFTQHLESAFRHIVVRHREGLEPEHIVIPPS